MLCWEDAVSCPSIYTSSGPGSIRTLPVKNDAAANLSVVYMTILVMWNLVLLMSSTLYTCHHITDFMYMSDPDERR